MATIPSSSAADSELHRKTIYVALREPRTKWHGLLLVVIWAVLFGAAVRRPALLDDADATHAEAARAILQSGDWVTLRVDGIRYLEKAPLPYWIGAVSLKLFGWAGIAFAIHLPLALTVLAMAALAYVWARRAFGETAALYAGSFVLTAIGVFLFTRIFIPDALLSLLLALALYATVRALEPDQLDTGQFAYVVWGSLALAVLTKGLVALVFFFGSVLLYLWISRSLGQWRRLRPWSGLLLLLAIAAPWHILAGVRNRNPAGGHGFFWFYFINEHVLRFLGRRTPRDYNKLPNALYWLLHLVWLFPWSLFAPAGLLMAWRRRMSPSGFARSTVMLLLIFSGLVMLFFSMSTNQEYYTFPVYLPLLLLLGAALAAVDGTQLDATLQRLLGGAFAVFTLLGFATAVALGSGLWSSRHLAFVPDIGAVLAHRGVGDYTLSMSHFFDLTGPSFAGLRLPAGLAAVAMLLGPLTAWLLYQRRRLPLALGTVALTSTIFLAAAHIALERFAPMLSSQDFAAKVLSLERSQAIEPGTQVLLFGDQAYGSSLPLYLDQQVMLVDGRSTSMLFGSTYPDAPHIFLTPEELQAQWGSGPRKILFLPLERREQADRLLAGREFLLAETSGKALVTDRPLESKQTK